LTSPGKELKTFCRLKTPQAQITVSRATLIGSALVSTRSGLRTEQSRVQIPTWAKDFSLLQNIQTVPGVHRSSCSMGKGLLSSGEKRLDCEANHSPSSGESQKEWNCASISCTP